MNKKIILSVLLTFISLSHFSIKNAEVKEQAENNLNISFDVFIDRVVHGVTLHVWLIFYDKDNNPLSDLYIGDSFGYKNFFGKYIPKNTKKIGLVVSFSNPYKRVRPIESINRPDPTSIYVFLNDIAEVQDKKIIYKYNTYAIEPEYNRETNRLIPVIIPTLDKERLRDIIMANKIENKDIEVTYEDVKPSLSPFKPESGIAELAGIGECIVS